MISIQHYKQPSVSGLKKFVQILEENGANPKSADYCDLYSRLDAISNLPGCYVVLGPDGGCLYVGKSKTLRRRIMSHIVKVNGERRWICNGYRVYSGAYAPAGSMVVAFESLWESIEDLEGALVKFLRPVHNSRMNDKTATSNRWV